jgi:hypothetical protein
VRQEMQVFLLVPPANLLMVKNVASGDYETELSLATAVGGIYMKHSFVYSPIYSPFLLCVHLVAKECTNEIVVRIGEIVEDIILNNIEFIQRV